MAAKSFLSESLVQAFSKIVLMVLLLAMSASSFAWQSYGPTKAHDSVIAIANKYKPKDVPLHDMVQAIKMENPKAFAGRHQSLKLGVKLKIPTTTKQVQAVLGRVEKPVLKKEKIMVAKKAAPLKTVPAPIVSANTSATATPAPVVDNSNSAPENDSPDSNCQATLNSLQQTLLDQQQSLQVSQNRIQELTDQLSSAGVTPVVSGSGNAFNFLSWASLWFVLLVLSLIFMWWMRRQHKKVLAHYAAPGIALRGEAAPAHEVHQKREPVIVRHKAQSTEDETPLEPDLFSQAEKNWQQVELDIPAPENQVTMPEQTTEPLLDEAARNLLAGEQDQLIKAIHEDEGNIDWHISLLEFYVKSNNALAFDKHFKMMVTTGLISEGDELWEKVRKMYLNKWVYGSQG